MTYSKEEENPSVCWKTGTQSSYFTQKRPKSSNSHIVILLLLLGEPTVKPKLPIIKTRVQLVTNEEEKLRWKKNIKETKDLLTTA